MAFDKPTRNRLAAFVAEARRLITDEFTRQFQSLYGIAETSLTELSQLSHLDDTGLAVAGLLRERIDYLVKPHPEDKEGLRAAVARLAREQAFTVLNRLAAVRMAEKRGLIIESVGSGYQSKGFKVFEQVARSGLGEIYQRYRRYLFCLFDELAVDLGVLFDRRSPQGLLFPGENTLLALLDLLNGPELEPLWQEDETIGWIYQYYNDPAERKKMREESSAPRNSRELAVRNQFFTPRYVVEFLTDNTLGRIWYEMTRGETQLKERCRYLVRRPTEVFLCPGETAPETPEQEGLSQEELLHQPVYVPHRALKDPRELRMLDPACGSMHFGLYAFDLYEVIYEEAWGRGMASLRADFPERDALVRAIPRLIIEHNIHGIDIDPRAVQIAGLSLWLRAQRSWQEQRLAAGQRPRIRRSNIVCAEPMPGDKAMLREFIVSQFAPEEQPAFTFLLERVFDRMALAGEAGSLLKIEEEISEAVREAKRLWQKGPQYEQGYLFAEIMPKQPEQLRLDLSGISDEGFWETAEERVYSALQVYAGQAESDSYQRRLFADDTVQGFAFIDLCRTRYDVALMNPPFGNVGGNAKDYIFSNHLREKTELAACFVTRAIQFIEQAGFAGVISNRTFLFADSFQSWREIYLKGISVCADLGFGVLDALVETAAFVVDRSQSRTAQFVALMNSVQKANDLLSTLENKSHTRVFLRQKASFDAFGTEWFYYWLPEGVLAKASDLAASRTGLLARPGLQTCDNFRFVRLAWEPARDRRFAGWLRLSKGGEYQPFWADVHLVTWWEHDGKEMKAFIESSYDSWSKQIPSVNLYTLAGLTYSERTTSSLSLRVFPGGCLFDKQGPFVGYRMFEANRAELIRFLGFSYCYLFRAIVESHIGLRDATEAGSPARHYMPSMIERLPLPKLNDVGDCETTKWVNECINFHRRLSSLDPTDSFHCAFQGVANANGIIAYQQAFARELVESMKLIYDGFAKADQKLRSAFQLEDNELNRLEEFFGPSLVIESSECQSNRLIEAASLLALPEVELVAQASKKHGNFSSILKQSFVANRRLELASLSLRCPPVSLLNGLAEFDWLLPTKDICLRICDMLIGSLFGRWDIRYASGERPAPLLPDPFAPLPACPPGMLQGDDGLPLTPEAGRRLCAVGHYPLDIAWGGLLVDDPGHPLDLEHRLREVFTVLWEDRAEAIEQEACDILGVRSLRDYFRKPSSFYADHLKRYSKSRRQAPIYWPLSTAKGSYTLWIYYHRLSDQTLHTALADFVDPKIKDIRAEISLLRESNNNHGQLDELLDLEGELLDFRAEIERIIKLPWQPNLNDGVLITAAPLWRLFRLPKWQKDLKACWDKLEKGEYDWAHLAYTIWPKRVEEVCKTDRSIAIAHGLEHLCQVEPPKPKAKRGRKKKAE